MCVVHLLYGWCYWDFCILGLVKITSVSYLQLLLYLIQTLHVSVAECIISAPEELTVWSIVTSCVFLVEDYNLIHSCISHNRIILLPVHLLWDHLCGLLTLMSTGQQSGTTNVLLFEQHSSSQIFIVLQSACGLIIQLCHTLKQN